MIDAKFKRDDRCSSKSNYMSSFNSTPMYFIRPFKEAGLSSWRYIITEINRLCGDPRAQQTVVLVFINLTITFLLLSFCRATNSMALLAYTYLSWFSLFSLITGLVCLWVEGQKATDTFTYGYVRCEALVVFVSVILCIFGALFIIKESCERFMHPTEIHTGLLSIGGLVGLILHLGMTAAAQNPPLTHVLQVSQSSLLQEHCSQICQSLCLQLPSLTGVLLPRINPLALISLVGFVTIIADHTVIQVYNYGRADTIAALTIAVLTIITMYPLCICSARLLLQTIPTHLMVQLDKRLHEALTLDGVLEFRNESFWVLGIGDNTAVGPTVPNAMQATSSSFNLGKHNRTRPILAGSLHVRIRRDANEQMVLIHIKERLAPLVYVLTIQVFKDDWTRSSTTLQLLKNSAQTLSLSSAHSVDYINSSYPSYSFIFPQHQISHNIPTTTPTLNTQKSTYSNTNETTSFGSKNKTPLPKKIGLPNLPNDSPPLSINTSNKLSNIYVKPQLEQSPNRSTEEYLKSPHYVNMEFLSKISTNNNKETETKMPTQDTCNISADLKLSR